MQDPLDEFLMGASDLGGQSRRMPWTSGLPRT